MRPLFMMLVLAGFAAAVAYFLLHRPHPVAIITKVESHEPARSLEDRAAAAQGTVYQEPRAEPERQPAIERAYSPSSSEQRVPSTFQCDGRTRCPQMRSCEEAEFFLRNCPGTKMDGDNDGVPCEGQWCGPG